MAPARPAQWLSGQMPQKDVTDAINLRINYQTRPR